MNAHSTTILAPDRLPVPVRGPRPRRRAAVVAGVLFGAGLLGAFSLGTVPRWNNQQALEAATAREARRPPTVNVVHPRPAPAYVEQVLPGDAQPYLQAAIYARTNGYLKRRLVDIGDRVEEGQLLAEISAPDVDAQLAQARSTLVQARANLQRTQADEVFAKQEEARYEKLLKAGRATTQEDYENKVALSKVATANVGAAQATIDQEIATVQRLETLQSFQRLTAPFSGIVTMRSVDPGALITADNPSTEQLLFRVADTHRLRVFVDVPQTYATSIQVGQAAVITRREWPGREFAGKVTRTANELDSTSRTLRTEVQVPNPNNELLPGMYLQVSFRIPQETRPLLVPGAAIINRTQGPMIAVLDAGKAVRYRRAELGRDHGAEIEVLGGLKPEECVVVHPGDDIPEGTVVEPVAPADSPAS